jgi:hypothetical protein
MSYTSIDIVRQYLVASFPKRDRYSDQPLVLASDDYLSFYNGTIEAAGFVVKSVQIHELSRQSITLSDAGNQVATGPVVSGSVVVASDSSLGTVYGENVDFVVDYQRGRLWMKRDGSLVAGQTVTVWCQAYHVYDSAEDYDLDGAHGRVKRRSGGSIAPGETVYLDFNPVDDAFNDDVLTRAVVEANGLLEAEIDPARQFGADPVLQAAATYRALEIICHVAAARELAGTPNDDGAALVWMKLGGKFADR